MTNDTRVRPDSETDDAVAAMPADLDRDGIEATIDLIRPALQMDGGDVELIEITSDGVVELQLHGACVGCPAAIMTLKAGIERILKDRHPSVSEVIAID